MRESAGYYGRMTQDNEHSGKVLERRREGGFEGATPRILQWMYVGRVAVAVALFIAAAFSVREVSPETILVLATAVIASVFMSGISVWYTHVRRSEPGMAFLYAQAVFDLVLITTVVHFTEGPASQFPALYILVIAVTAILMPLRSSLMITSLAVLLYLADSIWFWQTELSVAVWLQLAVFVAVFISTGLIASRVRVVGAEREILQEQVRRLRLEASDILANITSGVVTTDGEGRVLYANAAARHLLGFGGDVVGSTLTELVADRAPALLAAIKTTQVRRYKTFRAEGSIKTDSGSFPIGVTTTRIGEDDEGEPSVTAIFTDIADQKQLEALHLRAERLEAVAELSASLAHEIRNPLASIRSSIEQLSRSARADEDERFLAQLVLRESDRLNRLLTEFLDFARVQVTQSRPLDMGEIVEAAIEIVRQHPDCPDTAQIAIRRDPAPIEGDEDLLHRIVVNLVLNALQASDGRARVTIEVRRAGTMEMPAGLALTGAVLLSVADDGPGTPAGLRRKMFDPFVTGRIGGSGLGLAIVQRAVEAHRGVVLVDSALGKGTVFRVLLPAGGSGEVAA